MTSKNKKNKTSNVSKKKNTGAARKNPPKGKAAAANVTRLADFQIPHLDQVTSLTVPPVTTEMGDMTIKAMEAIMTKNKEQFEKLSHDAVNVGKDHVEALLKSGSIFMKGYEDIMKTYWGMAQNVAEKNGEAFKTLLTCKSVNEVADVQNRLAQEGFDELMTGVTRLSEMSVKLAADGLAPINEQLTRTIKKAGESLAA